MSRSARLLGISTETFCNVTEHRNKYPFDKSAVLRGSYTPNNYDEDPDFEKKCLFLSKSATNCFHKLSSPSQTTNVEPTLFVEFQVTATNSKVCECETENTFDAWMS